MAYLRSRLRQVERRVSPHGPTAIIGHSRAELEEKKREYLNSGGDPYQLVLVCVAKIEKEDTKPQQSQKLKAGGT
jgi:hypothetical protein